MAAATAPINDADAPQIRLLGSPSLHQGGRSVPLEADRAHGLLALLACRRDWLRRDELADLLYPGRDLESARSNLRKVLFLARRVEGVGEVEQRGDLLRWAPDSDLARFEAACDQRRYGDAVALYGGPLLHGLDAAWPPAARDWLDAERQRLQSRWHDACTRRLAELADDPPAQRALAETLLRHDPLDDVALQALARAQQALGHADEAMAALGDYTRRLSTELKLEPPAALRQLADDLRRPPAALAPAARVALPGPAALIGRRHEQALVRARLADPGCRLLTLLGPPGVGKSALARTLAAEHGGVWLGLEAVAAVDDVPSALAAALGLVPDGRLPPWPALAQALGERTALVVMDNVEALPLAAPLGALLQACPGLRVVATSRAPVGAAGEWRLPLDGLPLPDLDERDPEVLRANDAVALFERRVRPLVPGFDLAAEAADVVRLVHEVEGLPLAIELLAAWRRLMPVRAIVEELAASLELLEASAPGERSVRAAFDRSWRQLGAAEQRALARLALLPGPCDREMARQVVQAPLPVLAALVDRSLLRADEHGRFWLHPLVRRCAAAEAEAVEARAVESHAGGGLGALRERHARHAAATLSRPDAALAELIAHALAAWDWGVAQADAEVLGMLAGPLGAHLFDAARWRDALPRAQAAAAVLRPHVAASPARGPTQAKGEQQRAAALGAVLVMQAHHLYGMGELDGALAAAREGQAVSRAWGLLELEGKSLAQEGLVLWQRGDYRAAGVLFERHLEIARAVGDVAGERKALVRLGMAAKSLGQFDAAIGRYNEVLQAVRADGSLAQNVALLNNLGNLLRFLRRFDEARSLLEEGLKLARATGRKSDEPFLLVNLGLLHEAAGDLARAAALADEARQSASQHGEPMIEGAALLLCARVIARRERSRRGLADVHAALAIATRIKAAPLRCESLATAGLVLAATGDPFGVALLRWTLGQPDLSPAERGDALYRLAELGLADTEVAPLPADAAVEALIARLPVG